MSCSILVLLKLHASVAMALPRTGIVLLDVQRRTASRARVEARGLSVNHCSGLAWGCAVPVVGAEVDTWLIEGSHPEWQHLFQPVSKYQ